MNRKKQTNGDRIRQMTDEELAEIIVCPHEHEYEWPNEVCYEGRKCIECCISWLKQESAS